MFCFSNTGTYGNKSSFNLNSGNKNENEEDEEDFVTFTTNIAPDRQILGNHTWTLLHSQSVYWPDKPSENKKQQMKQFLNLLAELYPCKICGSDLKDILKLYPPELNSREEFAMWTCKIHNEVNKRINKPQFNCKNIWKRWRKDFKDPRTDIYFPDLDEEEGDIEEDDEEDYI